MLTVVVAWLAAVAVCLAAVLLGQTARTRRPPGRRGRRRSARARIGLFVSLSGPWLAIIAAAAAGAVSGQWLRAAALAVCWVAAAALAGVLLLPR